MSPPPTMSIPSTGILSHTQKVCSLYKRALRNLEDWYDRRHIYRYYAAKLRQRFEDNRCSKDSKIAEKVLAAGERELFLEKHFQPRKFAYSPGGVAYEREVIPPDWVLDYWHPLEKQQYPEYFAKREERKKDFVKFWEETYTKKGPDNEKDLKKDHKEPDKEKSCE